MPRGLALSISPVMRRRSRRRCTICGAIGRRASSDIFSSRRSNVSASQNCGSSVVIHRVFWSSERMVRSCCRVWRICAAGKAAAWGISLSIMLPAWILGALLRGSPGRERNLIRPLDPAPSPLSPGRARAHATEHRWHARRVGQLPHNVITYDFACPITRSRPPDQSRYLALSLKAVP